MQRIVPVKAYSGAHGLSWNVLCSQHTASPAPTYDAPVAAPYAISVSDTAARQSRQMADTCFGVVKENPVTSTARISTVFFLLLPTLLGVERNEFADPVRSGLLITSVATVLSVSSGHRRPRSQSSAAHLPLVSVSSSVSVNPVSVLR